MATSIERRTTELVNVTCDTAIADADRVAYGPYNSGAVLVPAGSPITTLTFHGVSADGTTFAATTAAAAAVTLTVAAAKSYALPADIAAYRAFKMVSNADGDVTLQLKG